jgi:hypothetical protein
MPLGDFRSVHLPYIIKRQEDGTYVVLNRDTNRWVSKRGTT